MGVRKILIVHRYTAFKLGLFNMGFGFRFHDVSEFDDARRSCRNRLADHNERRRKSSSEATTVVIGKGSRHESSSQVGERSIDRSNASPW